MAAQPIGPDTSITVKFNPWSPYRKSQLRRALDIMDTEFNDPHDYTSKRIYDNANRYIQEYLTYRTEEDYRDAIDYLSNYINIFYMQGDPIGTKPVGRGKKQRGGSRVDIYKKHSPLETIFTGITGLREGPGPKVREYLRKYQKWNVMGLVVCRQPVDKKIDVALNLLSAGRLTKRKLDEDYDELFHIYLLVYLEYAGKHSIIRVEKNQTVKFSLTDGKKMKGEECREVGMKGKSLTFLELIYTAEDRFGPQKFWVYDYQNQNCQHFLLDILSANGLTTPELKDFILQDVSGLLTPLMSTVVSTATNLAHKFNILSEGLGDNQDISIGPQKLHIVKKMMNK